MFKDIDVIFFLFCNFHFWYCFRSLQSVSVGKGILLGTLLMSTATNATATTPAPAFCSL